jgi:hypothetical protein
MIEDLPDKLELAAYKIENIQTFGVGLDLSQHDENSLRRLAKFGSDLGDEVCRVLLQLGTSQRTNAPLHAVDETTGTCRRTSPLNDGGPLAGV